MNKLTRLYNKNRMQFWSFIIIVICVLLVIQVFNYLTKIRNENKNNEIASNIIDNSYEEQSQSIVSGGSVSEKNRTTYGSLIEQFLNNCINNEVDKAYNALSTQCKEELYPTIEEFNEYYLDKNFNIKRTYTFQSWNSANVYLIKLC